MVYTGSWVVKTHEKRLPHLRVSVCIRLLTDRNEMKVSVDIPEPSSHSPPLFVPHLFAASGTLDIDGDGFTEFVFNGGEFGFGALNNGAFEPVAGAGSPPDGDDDERAEHHDRGVVEVQGRNGAGSGQHEEDGDQKHPDHSNPANRRAPCTQSPRAGGKVSGEAAQQYGQRIRDVEADCRDGGDCRVGGIVGNRRNSQDKGAHDREQDSVAWGASPVQTMPEVVEGHRAVTGEGIN